METIPSFYQQTTPVQGGQSQSANTTLRPGEVVDIIKPKDPRSRTKKFVEYNVLVQHREENGGVTKMYYNCLLSNPFMGAADQARFLLRTNKTKGVADKSGKKNGNGSKVLMLCINGEDAHGVVLGGLRDRDDSDLDIDLDTTGEAAQLDYEYNGIKLKISDDGGFSVTYSGATKSDGSLRDGVDDGAVGTKIEVSADGSFMVQTKDAEEKIQLDHKNGKLTVHANKIHIGDGAGEHAVLGDSMVSLFETLLDAMVKEQHTCAVGPTSPPLNSAEYLAVRAKLRTILSQFIFVKKTP